MRRTMGSLALAGAVALSLAGPARADERDDKIEELRELLRRYAEEQQRLREEVEALRQERAAPDPASLREAVDAYLREVEGDRDYVGPAGVVRPAASLDIGGYFSTLYRSSALPGERGTFVDMRLVPQIHAEISENIEFDSEVEIEHAGVGGPADGEIVVEYAELSFEFAPEFVFKAGTLLIPFGHFNLNHDDPMNELSSRPRVARFIVPSAFDLPGIGAEGNFEVGDSTVVLYDVALTNGFRDSISSGGTRSARGQFTDSENHHKMVWGRVAVVPTIPGFDAFSFAISGAAGRLGTDGGGEHTIHGYGADLQAKIGPWELMGEYDAFSIERASGSPPPTIDPTTGDPGPANGLSGYYLQLLHRIRGRWLQAPAFASENASLALVVRYDHIDLNDRVRGATPLDDENSWVFGINYRPTAKTVIKVEYRFADSPFPGREGDDRDEFVVEFATYF